MIEFLVAGIPLLLLMLAIVQLSLLWAGKSAVDTAAHLAARKFALVAREDFPKARDVVQADRGEDHHQEGGGDDQEEDRRLPAVSRTKLYRLSREISDHGHSTVTQRVDCSIR